MRLYIEIRPCAGGDEAEGFAMELLQTYLKYAKKHDLMASVVSLDKTKTIRLEGKEKGLKLLLTERGVHRVQRFSKGKLHTSTISVAVLEINEKEDYALQEKDLEISTFKSSGAGGQHVNKTESAVRIKHIPSQIVVACQSERSQHMNKAFALELLQSKLNQQKQKSHSQETNQNRKDQIGEGNRSESRRTYNFMRSEVYDHETGKKASLKDILQKANLEVLM